MTSISLKPVETYLSKYFDTQYYASNNYAPYLMDILSALGWRGDIKALRDALPYAEERQRLGFTNFLNVMATLGYMPKVIQTNSKDLPENSFPCLFIPKDKKANGKVLLEATTVDHKGRAFIFTESNDQQNIIPDKTIAGSDLGWFAKLLYRFKDIFSQIFLASLFINLLALATPIFMMSVYDKVIGAHSEETLKFLFTGISLAIGVEFSLRFLRTKSLAWFGARLDYIVSNAILEKLLALPASYTERANVAAQLSRLKAFESVREFFTSSLFLSFIEFPFVILLLAAIYVIGGSLVLIPLIIAGLYGLLLLVMHGHMRALTLRMATSNGERQNMNIETLSKQETLRFAGGYDAWLDRYDKVSAESSYTSFLYNQAMAKIDTISQSLIVLGGVAMIYFGVEHIWAGKMTMGGMIALLILTWRTLSPLQMVCSALPRMGQVKRNIEQINRLMKLSTEKDAVRTTENAPHFKGDIEFHNVGLRYSKDTDPVYAGLSFNIKTGDLVAIVGANSTGKSTTLKLVSGLYNPQAGSVRLDGVDIRQIDPVKLRQNIAYVAQEPEFFSMSVEENLRLVNPNASYEEIGSALKKAGLGEWMQNLPHGLETHLMKDKYDVPSTLKPQLALARAYVQNSAVILIDEMPYEFLNSGAGQRFFEFLKEQKGKRTVLYTTYRQDYIDMADIVIQLYNDERPQVKEKRNA